MPISFSSKFTFSLNSPQGQDPTQDRVATFTSVLDLRTTVSPGVGRLWPLLAQNSSIVRPGPRLCSSTKCSPPWGTRQRKTEGTNPPPTDPSSCWDDNRHALTAWTQISRFDSKQSKILFHRMPNASFPGKHSVCIVLDLQAIGTLAAFMALIADLASDSGCEQFLNLTSVANTTAT